MKLYENMQNEYIYLYNFNYYLFLFYSNEINLFIELEKFNVKKKFFSRNI